ncbi:hypothetical protein D3C78_1113500 [compost metagenome]
MADVVPLRTVGLLAFALVLVHVDHAAVVGNVLELGIVDHRMLARAVDHFQPDPGEDDADHAHDDEHVLPAEAVDDPAHQRCEQHGGKVLSRVEDRRGSAAFSSRKPGGDDARVAGEGWRFGQADQKAQHEQRDHCGGHAELADITLQHGEQRPGEDAQCVDFFRTETVQQPATGDLPGHVGPTECGEDVAKGNGVDAQVFLQAGAGDGDGSPVGVVDRGHQKQHEQDQIADVSRLLGRLHVDVLPQIIFMRGL